MNKNQKIAATNGARAAQSSIFTTFDDSPYQSQDLNMAWCVGLVDARNQLIFRKVDFAKQCCMFGPEYALLEMMECWKSVVDSSFLKLTIMGKIKVRKEMKSSLLDFTKG